MAYPPIEIWGHRGEGATDSAFARGRNDNVLRYPENTLPSFEEAFRKGVAAIETDAVRTRDNRIVLTHSSAYADHVDPRCQVPGRGHIDELDEFEVNGLRTGYRPGKGPSLRSGPQHIPLLSRLFYVLATKYRPGGPLLNLELKDCQGTELIRRTTPPISHTVIQIQRNSRFPLERIRFSSFSMDMLAEMVPCSPKARLALLTDIGEEADGDVGKPVFKRGSREVYLAFTPEVVGQARQRLGSGLVAIHPEIRTVEAAALKACAVHRLKIATWGWREQSPLVAGEFQAAALRAADLCRSHGVPLQLITDYPQEMRTLLVSHKFRVKPPRGLR